MAISWVYEHAIAPLDISVDHLGAHLVVCISGGSAPHIGSVALSTPRPSLAGSGTSATSSVLNRIGHKDEVVGREVADMLASRLDTVVCCICGIHVDDASEDEIRACATLGNEIATFLLERLEAPTDRKVTP